jgi:hypothetical protein
MKTWNYGGLSEMFRKEIEGVCLVSFQKIPFGFQRGRDAGNVSSFVKTTWGQKSHFSGLCPRDFDLRFVKAFEGGSPLESDSFDGRRWGIRPFSLPKKEIPVLLGMVS